jgi:hypothetical protein
MLPNTSGMPDNTEGASRLLTRLVNFTSYSPVHYISRNPGTDVAKRTSFDFDVYNPGRTIYRIDSNCYVDGRGQTPTSNPNLSGVNSVLGHTGE